MNFIPLAESLNRLFNRNKYEYTSQPYGVNILMNNSNEMLNPESIDVYEIYSTTPHLSSVIDKKGELLASGIWKHYKRQGEKIIEVENSEYVNILENPNPLYQGNNYLRLINENNCLYGNVFKYIQKGTFDTFPRAIQILPSFDVKIITKGGKWFKQTKIDEIIKEYEIISTNEKLELKDIIHTFKVNSKNPIQGETPLKKIYMPISNIRTAMKLRNIIMANKGALGILSNSSKDAIGTKTVDSDDRLKIEKQYQKDYGTNNGQAKVIITDSDLKWQAMSYPTKDLMLFEEDENDFQMICDTYGVSRDLFGQVNKATFTNQMESLKQTYQTSIIPESEELSMEHTKLFGLDGKSEWLALDYSHIPVLQTNEKEKAEVVKLNADARRLLIASGYTKEEIDTIIS